MATSTTSAWIRPLPRSRDRIYGNMYKTHLIGPWDNGVRHSFDINFPQDAWFGALNYTHVFSPSMLNEMGAGYTRTTVVIPCKYCDLLPTNINGIAGFGDGFSPVGFAQNDFHWRDMVTITRGKHALKTGFEWFHNQDYAPFTIPDNRQQAWGFDTMFDFAADKPDNYGTISFDPKTGATANNNRYFLDSTYGAYVQDDWKIRPDLTLNLGLRWDATSNPSEAHGTLSTLNRSAGSDLLTQIEGISVGLNPDPGKRRPFIDHKKTYFAPRFRFRMAAIRHARTGRFEAAQASSSTAAATPTGAIRRRAIRPSTPTSTPACTLPDRRSHRRSGSAPTRMYPLWLPASSRADNDSASAQRARRLRELQQHRRSRSAPEDGLHGELLPRRPARLRGELDRGSGFDPLQRNPRVFDHQHEPRGWSQPP